MVDAQRLYVSPLDSQLLPTVLSGSFLESARNISYHTLQTFPEKRYGYLELPVPDADRLKKKLHGSILRGMKMKVEKARPERSRKGSEGGDDTATEGKAREATRSKVHATKGDGVLPGVELPSDRKVKRGWTDSSATGKKSASGKKRTEKGTATRPSIREGDPECLFKITVPPNAAGNTPSTPQEATKSKKRKRAGVERSVVVQEFENTTKHPNFLRGETHAQQRKPASSYIEGRGWADEDGNIIEAEKEARKTRSRATQPVSDTGEEAKTQDSNSKPKQIHDAKHLKNREQAATNATIYSRNSATRSQVDEPTRSGTSPQRGRQTEASIEGDAGTGESSNSDDELNTDQVRALSIIRSSPTSPAEATEEVHPLEELFKRPKKAASQTPHKPSLEIKTGFSFFDPDETDEGAPSVVPQTPFTQRDFQERRHRSAAPTPDTAAPSKTIFGRLWSQESGEKDSVSDGAEEDAQSTSVAPTSAVPNEAGDEAKESEFSKWFYEHRGETNRAWKRRRREAAKEKRQKENKRR
ncbi:MAG: hypothetical protein LQ338_006131 [Usnochroma carphineum]|nr:MAG: hypothetical protein LQ338_006131 [Usnochroma carphineum]